MADPTTTIPIIPPGNDTTTTPTWGQFVYGPSGNTIALAVLGVILFCIAGWYLWRWMENRNRIRPEDYSPTLSDYDSEGVSVNMVSLVQVLMLMPAIGAALWAMMNYTKDPVATPAIGMAVVFFQFAMIAEMRRRTREKNSGMKVMAGWMRTKDGKKRRYYWRDVAILTERRLSDEDYEKVEKETKGEWTKEKLSAHHIYPVIIGNKSACYIITSAPQSEAFEWCPASDFDYWGDFKTDEVGPELHEVCTIHRVTNDYTEGPDETYYQRDEYIYVFVTAWDDKRSVDYRATIPPVDISRDAIAGQVAVALGVQREITAGMINTDRQTLMNLLNDQRKLDAMASSIGASLAAEIIEDKEKLGTLDRIGNEFGWVNLIKLAVVFFFGTIFGAWLW